MTRALFERAAVNANIGADLTHSYVHMFIVAVAHGPEPPPCPDDKDDVVVNWQRIAIGLTTVSFGLAVFLTVPLPTGQCISCGFARLAIATFAGLGVVMTAFPED